MLAEWDCLAFEFATQAAEPTGLGMLTVFEEMFWGDAGIALSILGTGLAAASLAANGTPEQLGEWLRPWALPWHRPGRFPAANKYPFAIKQ